jgi:sigma-B regulation protein RsbU (phosphoserine phosphatase)
LIGHSVRRIVQRANRQIKEAATSASFVTRFYAEFEERSGLLRYTNAGHNPPLLLRAKPVGELSVERLECGGTVLGLFADAEYEEAAVKLESGDVVVVFTDGLIEARNPAGEEFGEPRLLGLLTEHSHLSASELEKLIWQSVQSWTAGAEQEDDLTLLILKKV